MLLGNRLFVRLQLRIFVVLNVLVYVAVLGQLSPFCLAQQPRVPEVEEEEDSPKPQAKRGGKQPAGERGPKPQEKLPGADLPAEDRTPVHDLVTCALSEGGEQRPRPVRLIDTPLTFPLPPGREFTFQMMSKDGLGRTPIRVLGAGILSVQYFEELALERSAKSLGLKSDGLTTLNARLVSAVRDHSDKVGVALELLSEAISEHDSAVTRNIRQGSEWRAKRRMLVDAHFQIRLATALNHARSNRRDQAAELADGIRATPDRTSEIDRTLHRLYEEIFLTGAQQKIDEQDYVAARLALGQFLERFPREPGARATAIRQQLVAVARRLVDQAQQDRNPQLIEQAESIWPQIEGLHQIRKKLINDYPVLRIAYSELPKNFSPFGQKTTSERHAVALLFESLVNLHANPEANSNYGSQLSVTRPQALARGCVFELPSCVWSDTADSSPHLVTAEDVRWTVQLLKSPLASKYSRGTNRILADVEPVDTEHPSRISVRLQQDYWQPYAAMDFMITPKASFPGGGTKEEHRRFGANPVGTGPYRLRSGADPQFVRFEANPVCRPTRQPRIKEIVFYQLDSIEAQDAFLKGKLDLIYAVRPESAAQLRGQGKNVVKLPARSVHILAPNYRSEKMRNADLRRAVAHAIDREVILNANFRAGNEAADHAALTGPFPSRSWAYDQKVPKFSSSNVDANLARARQALGDRANSLELVIPDKYPEVAQACEQIRKQLDGAGIRLTTSRIPADRYFSTITGGPRSPGEEIGQAASQQANSFDLAYWQLDYQDESYWLWPLVNPAERGSGGTNFMGIAPDDTLTTLSRDFITHKQFRMVQQSAFKIHEYIYRNATFIPLWELDTYVAVGDKVQNAKFDSVTLFHQIEDWTIAAR